jgi:hypothetical protein
VTPRYPWPHHRSFHTLGLITLPPFPALLAAAPPRVFPLPLDYRPGPTAARRVRADPAVTPHHPIVAPRRRAHHPLTIITLPPIPPERHILQPLRTFPIHSLRRLLSSEIASSRRKSHPTAAESPEIPPRNRQKSFPPAADDTSRILPSCGGLPFSWRGCSISVSTVIDGPVFPLGPPLLMPPSRTSLPSSLPSWSALLPTHPALPLPLLPAEVNNESEKKSVAFCPFSCATVQE